MEALSVEADGVPIRNQLLLDFTGKQERGGGGKKRKRT